MGGAAGWKFSLSVVEAVVVADVDDVVGLKTLTCYAWVVRSWAAVSSSRQLGWGAFMFYWGRGDKVNTRRIATAPHALLSPYL